MKLDLIIGPFLGMMSMSDGKERFYFNERMRPIADDIYRAVFPNIVSITRFDKDAERHILDFNYAIDVELKLVNGMVITGQEKFREYSEWMEEKQISDVTVEYYNDPYLKIEGDWFNMAAQIYFVGFASMDEKKFTRWILLDWIRVVVQANLTLIKWGMIQNRPPAKANAKYAPFSSFDKYCVIASSDGGR